MAKKLKKPAHMCVWAGITTTTPGRRLAGSHSTRTSVRNASWRMNGITLRAKRVARRPQKSPKKTNQSRRNRDPKTGFEVRRRYLCR